ncbi:MAG: helix-hairpin-helix domain-containing protein [Myxococcales bacterium]|nr:helix-hairpin-helix domain-containing protein [Myxococcales bacterium]
MEPQSTPNTSSAPADNPTAADPSASASVSVTTSAEPPPEKSISQQLATAVGGSLPAVEAALALLAAGYAPSFIARHRKAQTKGLRTADLVRLANMHRYVEALTAQRAEALRVLSAGGNGAAELARELALATSRFDIADIVAEHRGGATGAGGSLADRREVRQAVRQLVWQRGNVVVRASETAKAGAAGEMPHTYEQFFELSEKVSLIPANRYLAICRGEAEGALIVGIDVDGAQIANLLKTFVDAAAPSAGDAGVVEAAQAALVAMATSDVRSELRERSESTSIDGLGEHLRKLLTAPPLGPRPVVALAPRLSAASDGVALDETGRLVATFALPAEQDEAALAGFIAFCNAQRAAVVAIGNGPGGMELYVKLRKHARANALASPPVVLVEDAASTEYGTSDLARRELAHVDLSLRPAVWLARRMQDPLVELVKVEPLLLAGPADHPGRTAAGLVAHLELVMTEAVTEVGVDLNTATAEQLTYIVGLGQQHAADIVAHRNVVGGFRRRDELMQVAGMTPLAYEQAASFLRIVGGSEPLDQTRLHPAQYDAARAVAEQLGATVPELLGQRERLAAVDLATLVTPERSRGLVAWLLGELGSPWRDRRAAFKAPKRRDDVVDIHDLTPGMVIEGVVASVAPFGLFIDLGIYQDGLVHISQILKQFGREAARVAVVGHPLRVTVVEVDIPRKRISLLPAPPEPRAARNSPRGARPAAPPRIAQKQAEPSPQLLAALAKPVPGPRPAAPARSARGADAPRPRAPHTGGDRARPSAGAGAGAGASSRRGAARPHQVEEAQVEARPGFGLSGFTNSPFAKLAELKK